MSAIHNTDEELVRHALRMWANHIETGNVNLTATDVSNMGGKHKALSTDQMKLVLRLRGLASSDLEFKSHSSES